MTLTAPESGKCEFSISGNGGVRVTIDGKQIDQRLGAARPPGRGMMFGGADLPERTAEVSFEKGKTYKAGGGVLPRCR